LVGVVFHGIAGGVAGEANKPFASVERNVGRDVPSLVGTA
jgi:hypothetical protein